MKKAKRLCGVRRSGSLWDKWGVKEKMSHEMRMSDEPKLFSLGNCIGILQCIGYRLTLRIVRPSLHAPNGIIPPSDVQIDRTEGLIKLRDMLDAALDTHPDYEGVLKRNRVLEQTHGVDAANIKKKDGLLKETRDQLSFYLDVADVRNNDMLLHIISSIDHVLALEWNYPEEQA